MYERFTDRARNVIHLANREAKRFNLEYVTTEHILLGLLQETSSIAVNALRNLEFDLGKLYEELVKQIVQPDSIRFVRGPLPQSPSVKQVIADAIEEAELLDASYVGTEHLLLALVRQKESVAAQVLIHLGLKLEDVRGEVLRLLGREIPVEKASYLPPRAKSIPKSAEPDNLVVMEKKAMYERFTDRARKVLQLANQEAHRFNHEYTGTEHILLGLVKEGSGVAANVLKNLDIDLRKIRLEVEKIVQPGPDKIQMSKLLQTPRAKKVIEYAIEEARNLNHNYVGTEHLLLGLLREGEGVAAQVLINLGLKLEDVRDEVLEMLGQKAPVKEARDVPQHPETSSPCAAVDYLAEMEKEALYEPFTDSARKVMHWANKEAVRFKHEYIATEHLLLGLLKEGCGVAARVLMNLGLDVLQVRAEVVKSVGCGPRRVWSSKLPLTLRTKKVIEYARDEAGNLLHSYIGTEHLLLGLTRDPEGIAGQVLRNLGVSVQKIREEVLNLLGQETTAARKSDESAVHPPHPLVCEANQAIPSAENRDGPSTNDVLPSPERERIRSLEQQLWNVRVVLGALMGALAGVLLFTSLGAVIGLLVGGVVAALGWRFVGILAGGGAGALLGCVHLASDGGGFAGALLGALLGYLIADIGRWSER